MNTEIITIGDEILIGQIVDSNSAFMARELNKAGFWVHQITSVSDNEVHISQAINEAMQRTDIVLVTGGLGPTKDDITKQTLCKLFDTELVFSEEVLHTIEARFSTMKGVMNELTRNQAYVPRNSTVIQNRAGSAPIMWFEREGKILVSMPGVPSEMEWAMINEIIPRLQKRFNTPALIHKTLLVTGFPESQLAITIEDWENSLPEFIKLAYLPSFGLVKLRLSGSLPDKAKLESIMNAKIAELRPILGNSIFAEEDLPLEVIIGNLLKEKGITLSTAESCTGGNIARLITSVAGSSAYFKGSVVAYNNEVKEQLLGVSAEDLKQLGAVSQEVVEQMAKGIMCLTNSDIAVATSGIAGPDGGTPEKPVGIVWIAVCTKEKTISRKYQYGNGSRDRNTARASLSAFVMLKEMLENEKV
ncbi:MAG: competence/damage-inducible protein A [Prevotellaceae bacterium]|jgi:nicotinamide-nucleotide amidase|nr:competence/damage-inducible protein A [Prevotellaceae bacterium]